MVIQGGCGWIVGVFVDMVFQIDMDVVVEEGICCQYYGFVVEGDVELGGGFGNVVVFDCDVIDCRLEQCQIRLVFQMFVDCCFVQYMVGLGMCCVYCWVFGGIEDVELDI